MKVVFTDSFFDSLKKLQRDNTWYMKTINFFRYDIPRVFKNLKRFRKLIWTYYAFSYQSVLTAMLESLKPLAESIKNGNEVDESRLPKYETIKKCITILENINSDNYIEQAEKELGSEVNTKYMFKDAPKEVDANNKTIYDLATEKENLEWDTLWAIIKGNRESRINGEAGMKSWWN